MPMLDEAVDNGDFLARVLAYGPSQSRKTLWAGKAAEAGFNVILPDGDGNSAILHAIKPDARKRIALIKVQDELTRPVFWPFLVDMLKGKKLAWDEQDKRSRATTSLCNPEHSHFVIDPSKFTNRDVLIIDSWTAASVSAAWNNAIATQVDLSTWDKAERDDYGLNSRTLSWALPLLKALKCHLIVIGHSSVYEKRTPDGKTVIFSRTQPISSSNNHSMVLAKNFTDTLYFSILGTMTRIDTSPSSDRDCGSRFVPPGSYTFEDGPKRLQFGDLLAFGNVKSPGVDTFDSEAVKYYPPGATPEIGGAVSQPKTIQTNQDTTSTGITLKTATPQPLKVGGLAAMLSNKKASPTT